MPISHPNGGSQCTDFAFLCLSVESCHELYVGTTLYPLHDIGNMIFPYKALEEGKMDDVVSDETLQLFVHTGRKQPWEKMSDIKKWTAMNAGRTLRDVLDGQVKREMDGLA